MENGSTFTRKQMVQRNYTIRPNDIAEIHNLADKKEYKTQLELMRNQLRKYAVEFNDENILDGDNFVKSEIDREQFKKLPVSGMGWRWY